ncbi:MAG: Mur ligase family protein [Acidobacteriota bacterium]
MARLAPLKPFAERPRLERMRGLLPHLGHPETSFPTVLVAGTNGKGSTAALFAAMARAAGYRVGLYTSPHLETVHERITVDGALIADDRLAALIDELLGIAAARRAVAPTFFEALTLAALLHFRAEAVDLAVIEVGLGGRLDATNVCDPRLSIVTSIGYDHTEHLGDTLEAIAREKAGIFRAQRPAVAWRDLPEIARSLSGAADACGAQLRFADDWITVEPESPAEALPEAEPPPDAYAQHLRVRYAQHLRVRVRGRRDGPAIDHAIALGLAGVHQRRNLGLAVFAAHALAEDGFAQLADPATIARGVARCRWPGRLEWIRTAAGPPVLLDGAHNADGAAVLASYLRQQVAGPFELLMGTLANKRVKHMLPHVADGAAHVTLTRAAPSPRGADPADLQPLIPGHSVTVEPDAERALDAALDRARAAGRTLVICGSLYLVGDLRPALRARLGAPASPWDASA